jgi:hypothetical protein
MKTNVQTVDLTGDWIGFYEGHHDEVVRVTQSENQIEAIKVTGDTHVPAGEITFRAELDGTEGRGEGQVASEDFHNPRFIPGHLHVIDGDHFEFTWSGLGTVEFRRDV